MQWSKLKTRAKSFIVPSLRKRIDFHVTSYRRSHDEAEKAWVTLDGEQVFTASWYRHQYAGAKRTTSGTLARDGQGRPIRDPAMPVRAIEPEELELHQPQQFGDALRLYLDIPVADALKSRDPFIRAMAMIDRRVGGDRLRKHKPRTGDHSLVRLFYDLRVQSDHSE
jgi:hypothetical protein